MEPWEVVEALGERPSLPEVPLSEQERQLAEVLARQLSDLLAQ